MYQFFGIMLKPTSTSKKQSGIGLFSLSAEFRYYRRIVSNGDTKCYYMCSILSYYLFDLLFRVRFSLGERDLSSSSVRYTRIANPKTVIRIQKRSERRPITQYKHQQIVLICKSTENDHKHPELGLYNTQFLRLYVYKRWCRCIVIPAGSIQQ